MRLREQMHTATRGRQNITDAAAGLLPPPPPPQKPVYGFFKFLLL